MRQIYFFFSLKENAIGLLAIKIICEKAQLHCQISEQSARRQPLRVINRTVASTKADGAIFFIPFHPGTNVNTFRWRHSLIRLDDRFGRRTYHHRTRLSPSVTLISNVGNVCLMRVSAEDQLGMGTFICIFRSDFPSNTNSNDYSGCVSRQRW